MNEPIARIGQKGDSKIKRAPFEHVIEIVRRQALARFAFSVRLLKRLPLQHAHSSGQQTKPRAHAPSAPTATPSPRRCAAPKPAQKPRKKLLQQKFDPGKRSPASKPWSMPRSMKFRWPVAPRPRFCTPGRNPFPTWILVFS